MPRQDLLAQRRWTQVSWERRHRVLLEAELQFARQVGAGSLPRYLRAKRMIDVLLSLATLLLLFPIVVICVLALKLESRGPALVQYPLIGLRGRKFGLWRLRTTVNGSTSPQAALTRVGRLLRRTHFDELPALINVLRGEMSLVGPAPTPSTAAGHPLWHTARFEAKPGLTGPARIATRHRDDTDECARLDIAYIRVRTIAADTRILARSVALVLTGGHGVIARAESPAPAPPNWIADTPPVLTSRPALSVPQLGAGVLAIADIAAAGVALSAAYSIRFNLQLGTAEFVSAPPTVEYVKLFVVIGATISVIATFQQLYRPDSPYSTLEENYAIAKAVSLGTALGLASAFFYRDFNFSRLTLAYFWMAALVMIGSTHAVYRRWLLARIARGLDLKPTIVVGRPSDHLLHRLRSEPSFSLRLVGWLGPAAERDGASRGVRRTGVLVRSARLQPTVAFSTLPRLGSIDDAPIVIARSRIESVMIIEHSLTHAQLLETIDACERHDVDVQLIPPIYDLLIDPTDLAFISGVPALRITEARAQWTQTVTKRIFDLVFSGVLLILLAPLMLGIAVAIRRSSRGPVLFRQLRAGKNGRPFEMLKFRSMAVDAEQRLAQLVDVDTLAEPVFKIANDPRVTPVGRWLRRFSLDELPQLINVFRGDMTLVGPRPEELKIVQRYDIWQRRRLKMKPGITGLQQVIARGALSNLSERVRLDMYYTRKQSLLLDLVILGKTVGAVLSGRGAT
jgi:exopolysaccharide biosynthesis polyprenyl glycosylphosphotransferase